VTAFTHAAAADPTSEPARDGLMTAFAATLPERPGQQPLLGAQALGVLAGDLPDDVDVLAVLGPLDTVGRARLAAGVHAVYSERPGDEPAVARVGAAELDRLAITPA
jgi:hypothetical protein